MIWATPPLLMVKPPPRACTLLLEVLSRRRVPPLLTVASAKELSDVPFRVKVPPLTLIKGPDVELPLVMQATDWLLLVASAVSVIEPLAPASMMPVKTPLPPWPPTVYVGVPPDKVVVTVPEPFKPLMVSLFPFRSKVPLIVTLPPS